MITELFGIMLLSIAGSWHCAGMCGAFCLIAAEGKKNKINFYYHSGRIITYVLLVTLAYYSVLPIKILFEKYSIYLLVSVMVFSFILFWFMLKSLNFIKVLQPALKFITSIRYSSLKSLLLGATTTLLPCAWLYSFVAYASTKNNLTEAIVLIFFFWLGTLPALFALEFFTFKSGVLKKLRYVAIMALFVAATAQLILKNEHLNHGHDSKLNCQPLGSKTEKTVP